MVTIRPKVLFIAANSRSGSTILDRLLAQIDGAFTAGELRYIWQRSFIENQLCGCHSKFDECSVWKRIVEHASLDSGFAGRMSDIARYVDRFKQIPRITQPLFRTRSFETDLAEYIEGIRRIYDAIQQTVQPEFIIDSSKSPNYAMILRLVPGIDVHFVHLVRDCRAVAYSRMNVKKRPEIHWKEEYTAVTSPYKTALQWNIINHALGLLQRNSSYSLVRYEDFISNPQYEVMKIAGEIGKKNVDISFIDGSAASLKADHTLSGNPMRFTVGDIELRLDERWKNGLSAKHRRAIEYISRSALKRYRYL